MSSSFSYLMPGAFSYSPSWTASTTNPTLGNGTLVSSYMRFGPMVVYSVDVTFASGTSAGDGAWSFSLPVAAKNGYRFSGGAFLFDNGTAFDAGAVTATSMTLAQITSGTGNGNYANASYPFDWTSGDRFAFTLVYEAAG